jgi:hypothetical protein
MSTIDKATLLEGVGVGIIAVEVRGEFVLHVKFDDAVERDIDFGPFLRASSNPQIRAYLDRGKFQSYSLKEGELVWGDYELCFPIADLYEGNV